MGNTTTNPMEAMLGKVGTAPACNQLVHWWKEAKPGAKCLCGQKTYPPKCCQPRRPKKENPNG